VKAPEEEPMAAEIQLLTCWLIVMVCVLFGRGGRA
jgi:hypothetical protein